MSAGEQSETGKSCPDNGVDGGPVRLHLDGNAMGGRSSRVVTCLTGNQRLRQEARAVLAGEEERVKTFWVLGHWEVLSDEF